MKKVVFLLALVFSGAVAFAQNVPVISNTNLTQTVTEAGTIQQINLSALVSGTGTSTVTYAISLNPTQGTATINATTGMVTYVHSGAHVGSDSFNWTATTSDGSASGSVAITVTLTNDAPVITAAPITVDEGKRITQAITSSDEENNPVEFEIVLQPTDGTLIINSNNEIVYTHNGNDCEACLTDTFSIRVKEQAGSVTSPRTGNTATYTVNVTQVNDAPTASAISLNVNEGATATANIVASDSDTPANNLSYSVVTQPQYGTLTISSSGAISYVHNGSESTLDSFEYQISDGALSNKYTVPVLITAVNDAPVGVADSYFVLGTNPITINANVGVLSNDTDAENDAMTVVISDLPTSGTVSLSTDGGFVYTPISSNSTQDTFSYIPKDANGLAGAEVIVTIEFSTIAPAPERFTTTEGGTITTNLQQSVLLNDKDSNNLSLTAEVVTAPLYGTLTLNADGTFTYVHDGSENRRDRFTYKAINSNGDESKAIFVVIDITNVNDAPVAESSTINLSEGETISFYPLYTDTDSELQELTFRIFSATNTTTASLVPLTTNAGVLSVNESGQLVFIHNGSETFSAQYYYQITDGALTSSIEPLTIEITPVNDAPVALGVASGTIQVNEGASISGNLLASDVDSEDLEFFVVTRPTYGSISINANGSFTYVNNGSLQGTVSGDRFVYNVSDGTSSSANKTVEISVSPVNDAPVAEQNVSINVDEGGSISFGLLNRFQDEEQDPFTIQITTNPVNGTISATTGQQYLYTHNGSETESDVFAVTATDSQGASTTMSVTVNIAPINDTPVLAALNDPIEVDQLDEVTFTISASDADQDELTYTISTPATRGTLTNNQDGSFTYVDNSADADKVDGSFTPVTFGITVNDGEVDSAERTYSISITDIDENLPMLTIASTSGISSINEGQSTTLRASLISNDFYSRNRDLPAALSSKYTYLGEYNGHTYYVYTGANNEWENSQGYSFAVTKANEAGGYPVVFETAAEFDYFKANFNVNFSFWLGTRFNYVDNKIELRTNQSVISENYLSGTATSIGRNYDNSIETNGSYLRYTAVAISVNGWSNTDPENGNWTVVEFDKSFIPNSDISFTLSTTGSTAETDDYSLSTSTFTIPANTTGLDITLTTSDDTLDEPKENILFTLGKVGEGVYNIRRSQKTLSIDILDNDDTSVGFTYSGVDQGIVSESNSEISIIATLENPKPFETSLLLDFGGTAEYGEDYTSQDTGFVSTLMSNQSGIRGVAKASNGDLYFITNQNQIKKATSASGYSTITNYNVNTNWGNHTIEPVSLAQARFRYLRDIVIDSNDDLYIIDDNYIRKIDTSLGVVSFVAGADQWDTSSDGTGAGAKFRDLRKLAINSDGSKLYVLENSKIRQITFNSEGSAVVTTIIGNGSWDYIDGPGLDARLREPRAIAVNTEGELIIAEHGTLRKYVDGVVSTIVEFGWEKSGLALSQNYIYFSSSNDHQIYRYNIVKDIVEQVAGRQGISGSTDGAVKTAKIERPEQLMLLNNELLFVESNNGKARKIDFLNKLRIPAGQSQGTFKLSLTNDSFYELPETIELSVTEANGLAPDGTTSATITLTSDDTAPEVRITSSVSSIAEQGGSALVTIQLGQSDDNSSKIDMDEANKGSFVYLGEFQGSKYYLANNGDSWTQAQRNASNLGGYLLTINSEAENNFIKGKMTNQIGAVWLGFTDRTNEGTFVWENGSKSTFTNWGGNSPDNNGDEDYAEMYQNGQWNDRGDGWQRYIVEYSGTKSSLPTAINYTITGTDGFEEDFSIPAERTLTIPAGQSRASFTVSSTADLISESRDFIDITLTSVDGENGIISDTSGSVQIEILDDDAPAVEWSAAATTLVETSETGVKVTASTSVAKQQDIVLSLSTSVGEVADTATFNSDYFIPELNTVSTLAGSGRTGFKDGKGTLSSFRSNNKIRPYTSGSYLIADPENNTIRLLSSDGTVSTFAGNGNWGHDPAPDNTPKLQAALARPSDAVMASNGDVYIAESGRNRISKISAQGLYSVVAGNGEWGSSDGSGVSNTSFQDPRALAIDSRGNLYVVGNNRVRKIAFTDGVAEVSTFAGDGNWGRENGEGINARFENPQDVVIDAQDNLYVGENNRIRKITSAGVVSTLAGEWWDDKDGTFASARFNEVTGLAFDQDQNLLIVDASTGKVKRAYLTGPKSGLVETIAGGGNGFADGSFAAAKFKNPRGIVSGTGKILISDTQNYRIRQILTEPTITIPAGQTSGSITLMPIDDTRFEADETITLGVESTEFVADSSVFADLSVLLTSDDAKPQIRLASSNVFVDEAEGTAQFEVVLVDQYSSPRTDMEESKKSGFYYLGEFEGSKYYASRQNWQSYQSAKALATSLGGQLAVITTAKENDFITNKIYEKDPDFSLDNNRWLNHWIGYEYNTEAQSWAWANGFDSSFVNWSGGNPNNPANRRAVFLGEQGFWNNTNRSDNRLLVVEYSSAKSDVDTQVVFNFDSSTAQAEDYSTNLTNNTLVIPSGSAKAVVQVTGVDDELDEAVESIVATFDTVDNATIDNAFAQATILIKDDELPAVTLSADNTEISEQGGTMKVVATIENAKLNPVQIDLSFLSDLNTDAIYDKDFSSSSVYAVSTLAGTGVSGYVDGPANTAQFGDDLFAVASDSQGNTYVADPRKSVIRKIDTQGNVSTFAGSENWKGNTKEGFRTAVDLYYPRAVAVDAQGNLYIYENHLISVVNSSGQYRVLAGTQEWGHKDGAATDARFRTVSSMAIDQDGNLVVIDEGMLRKITLTGQGQAVVKTLVGKPNECGYRDGFGTEASFSCYDRKSLAIAEDGSIYIADGHANAIRKYNPTTTELTTIAGGSGWGDKDGYGRNAQFRTPSGIAVDADGNLFVSDSDSNTIRRLSFDSEGVLVKTIAGSGSNGFDNGSAGQATFARPTYLNVNQGKLIVVDQQNFSLRKLTLTPQIIIPAGQTSATFSIEAIDDIVYEPTEQIRITNGTIIGGTLSPSVTLAASLLSNDTKPFVTIEASQLVLNENGGTLVVEVKLNEEDGAESIWANDDMPEDSKGSFAYLGSFEGHKYYQSSTRVNFTNAQKTAEALGGQLLIIDNQEENQFIASSIRDGAWLGITDTEAEGDWKPFYGNSSYLNFDSNNNQPDGGTNENYAVTYGNRWYDVNQNNSHSFIIEYGPTKSSGIDTPVTIVASGTASGEDYSVETLDVVIPAGSSRKSIVLTGVDDSLDEPIENIVLTVSEVGVDQQESPVANISETKASVTIKLSDDEAPAVTFALSETEIAENGGSTTVGVTLSNEKINPTFVDFNFGGTAKLIDDYISADLYGVSTFSGTPGVQGFLDGDSETAQFQDIRRIMKYDENSYLIADFSNRSIRKLFNDGRVESFIGSNNSYNNQDGLRENVGIERPHGFDVDAQGVIYFVGEGNRVRKYDPATDRITTIAGSGEWGQLDGNGSNASFRQPRDIAVGADGKLYVADQDNGNIRIITPNESGGYTVSSMFNTNQNDGNIIEGPISEARIGRPEAIEYVEATNKLYVLANGYALNVIDLNNSTVDSYVLTDGGNQWGQIQDISVDDKGDVYFVNTGRSKINKLSFIGLPEGLGAKSTWTFITDNNGRNYDFYQKTGEPNKVVAIVEVIDPTYTQIWQGGQNTGTQYGNNNGDQILDTNVSGGWIGFQYFSRGTYQITIDTSTKRFEVTNVASGLTTSGYKLSTVAGNGERLYVDGPGTEASFKDPISILVDKNNALVYDSGNAVFRKIVLNPRVEVRSGEKTASMTLNAFKDQYFEGVENIDLSISQITNGTSTVSSLASVSIKDATVLTLVQNAPFVGVENGKVSWGDYDRDGDMDLLIMGQSEDGTITNIYRNNNGTFQNTNQNFTKYIGGDIEFVDVDQDGWLDVAVSGNSVTGRKSELYINKGAESPTSPYFELMTNYQVEGLSQSDMAWGDLDNDGDPDLVIAGINDNNEYRTLYYTNLGNYKFLLEPLFQAPGVINGQVDIVDYDSDGDNDLFVLGKTNQGNILDAYLWNTYFDSGWSNGFDQIQYESMKYAYLDIDSDGEVDYYSMGKTLQGQLKQSSNLNISLQSLSKPDLEFADFNNDGRNDVVLTGEDLDGTPVTKLYATVTNQGPEYALFDTQAELIGLRESTVNWIDYDLDGDLDLFMTGLDTDGRAKSVLYKADNFENLNTPPAKVTNVQATDLTNGLVRITWDKPEDNVSTEFRYAVRIGTTPGGSEVRYVNSNLSNGKTLLNVPSLQTINELEVILDPGTYYVSVQAIDGGNMGGLFSDEISVDLDYNWKKLNLGGIIDRRLKPQSTSKLEFVDIDNDNDMDLISTNVGMNSTGSNAVNIYKFENGVFVPIQNFWGGLTTFGLGDLNNNGNIDLVLAQEESNGTRINFGLNNMSFIEEAIANGAEVNQSDIYNFNLNLFQGDNFIPSLFNSKVAIKDLNNDGLTEVILAGSNSKIESEAVAAVYVLEMVPVEGQPLGFDNFRFVARKLITNNEKLDRLSFISFDLGDVDNDNDYDLLVSGYGFDGYKTILFKNTGDLQGELFVETQNNFVSVKDGSASFVDFDGDGKVDVLFSGQSAEGDVFKAYKNTGNIQNFAAIELNLPAIRNSKLDFGDFNGDGYYDLLYSGTIQGEGRVTKLSEFNPINKTFVPSSFDVSMYLDAQVGFGDFDGDNDLDFVLTGQDSEGDNNTYLSDVFINVRGAANNTNKFGKGEVTAKETGLTPPSAINVQRRRISEELFEVTLTWSAGGNREGNPDSALTYSLKIGSTPGAEDILSSGADENGVRKTASKGNAENNLTWRVNLKTGDYYAQVQSVDASFIGSAFSEAKEFSVVNSFKLGDANGDDSVNVLDLTTNIDYILGNNPAIFINEVADVNLDGVINVTDLSGIVAIIMNGGSTTAKGDQPDYFSSAKVGDAQIAFDGLTARLSSEKPVQAIQFSIDQKHQIKISEQLKNNGFEVVKYNKDGKNYYMIYSLSNKNILDFTTDLFESNAPILDKSFSLQNLAAATEMAGTMEVEFKNETYLLELKEQDRMMVYPNPAIDQVNVLMAMAQKGTAMNVEVYNLLGNQVLSKQVNVSNEVPKIDMSMLPEGFYTIKAEVINEEGERVVKYAKIIKKK